MSEQRPYDDTLREHLREFDTIHLQKLFSLMYDRWNWETGTDSDHRFMNIVEETLGERGMSAPTNTNGGPNISGQGEDLHIHADGITLQSPNWGPQCKLFEFGGSSQLQLGYEAKQALLKFLTDELGWSNTVCNENGQYLKHKVEDIVRGTNQYEIDELKRKVDEQERIIREMQSRDHDDGR